MTTDLAIREETGLTPREVAEVASAQATTLMDIVEKKQLYVTIGKKKHLVAEAWQVICAFNDASPITEWVKPIEENGQILGWQARVLLVKHGETISAGEMSCGLEEFPCRGKEGMAKHRAAQSAAMTWAMAKAARMKFAWVAVLGDYAPTPAEETISDTPSIPHPAQATRPAPPTGDPDMVCPIHGVRWFKNGKMRQFAHAVPGEPWCNMNAAKKNLAQDANDLFTGPRDTPQDAAVDQEAPSGVESVDEGPDLPY